MTRRRLGVGTAWTVLAVPVLIGLSVRAQQADVSTAARLDRAGIHGRVDASCPGAFRAGHDRDIAVAVSDGSGSGRYLVLQDDGRTHELSAYTGKPELSCYSVADADRLTASIARSDTINGRVTAEWDGTVVCGFIEPTIAVCWQFAPEQGRFVRIGGWTT